MGARAGLSIDPSLSALLCRRDDILLAGFHTGRVYSLRDGTVNVVAEGFTNPTALASDGSGGVLVINFGSGSIGRILP